MAIKKFTKVQTIDGYNSKIIIYRPFDAKFSITAYPDKNGLINWVKLRTLNGPGNDNALNITTEWFAIIADINKDIVKMNKKLSSQS